MSLCNYLIPTEDIVDYNPHAAVLNIYFYNLPCMPRNQENMVVRGRQIKSPLAREYKKEIQFRLSKFTDIHKTQFLSTLKPNDELSVHIKIYTPKSRFFTKEGRVSQRRVDNDAHKSFMDSIFEYLGVDDSLATVTVYHAFPVDNDEFCFGVTIQKGLKVV